MIIEQGSQTADVPPLELHRAFVGRSGEFRAGPVDPWFERLFAELMGQTSQVKQVVAANWIDRYVTRQGQGRAKIVGAASGECARICRGCKADCARDDQSHLRLH
ncbi:MAG: hypothetical protein M3460_12050 [Actinomycetota bacterium]|nr:hypothetical protein [Actinomycetota bacterium]